MGYPKQYMATLQVLMLMVKAWCSFKVVSGVSGNFGDPYSTKVLRSPVFDRISHENGVPRRLSSEGLVLPARRAVFGVACLFFSWIFSGTCTHEHTHTRLHCRIFSATCRRAHA